MSTLDFVLGIDSSTQGTAVAVLQRNSFQVIARKKLTYRDDSRLSRYLPEGSAAPLLPAEEEGEADQPPAMYLAALNAAFDDLGPQVLARVAAVNVSAQQHGQVWISQRGIEAIRALREPARGAPDVLTCFPEEGFAHDRSPIWMTTSTAIDAEVIRAACGGSDDVTSRSGSDSPLRFSGAVLRHVALRHPRSYRRARRVHLISSFLTAVLSGNPDAPIDWGNGSGTSLMNWRDRTWDRLLVSAVAHGLPGDADGLLARLPPLSHPLEVVGTIAPRLSQRYGFSTECLVVAGSGDNPQTKVLATGELLSLGTSFVVMTAGDTPHRSANAMYDGLGRPFLFGCRTNGALSWEAVRIRHGLEADNFAYAERALSTHSVGEASADFIFQPALESFPECPRSIPTPSGDFAKDYAATVDSSLSLTYLASRPFSRDTGPVFVAGGIASSSAVLQRVATIWGRPALRLSDAGASTGAAVAAAVALAPLEQRDLIALRARHEWTRSDGSVSADQTSSAALRASGGYFDRLSDAYERLAGRRLID